MEKNDWGGSIWLLRANKSYIKKSVISSINILTLTISLELDGWGQKGWANPLFRLQGLAYRQSMEYTA